MGSERVPIPKLVWRLCVAVPLLLLAVAVVVDGVYESGVLFTPEAMHDVMLYELFGIGVFPLLIIAAASRPASLEGKAFRCVCLVGFAWAFCAIGWSRGGLTGALAVWGMGAATYGCVMFGRVRVHVLQEVTLRWLLSWLTLGFGAATPYALWLGSDKAENVLEHPAVFAIYFVQLAVLELCAVYPRLLNRPDAAAMGADADSTPAERTDELAEDDGGAQPSKGKRGVEDERVEVEV